MLVALTLSVATAALNSRAKLLEELPKLAFKVTVCAVPTGDTVAMNPALVASAGTVTFAGTTTAALLLDRLTLSPPLAAAELSLTVQSSVPDPVLELLSQERSLNAGDGGAFVIPVPFKLMTTLLLVETSLVTMRFPVAVPGLAGLNCTSTL